jgi:hypothetical protein
LAIISGNHHPLTGYVVHNGFTIDGALVGAGSHM